MAVIENSLISKGSFVCMFSTPTFAYLVYDAIIRVRFATKAATLGLTMIMISSFTDSSLSANAIVGHGSAYGPSFGSGILQYSDGLKINNTAFNISKYSQMIDTQKLHIGSTSTFTVKMFENGGAQNIQHVTLFLNIKDSTPKISDSGTWIEYDNVGGVSLHDPHKFFSKATATVSYQGSFMYVTFNMTPKSFMNTSDIIISAWDRWLSVRNTTVINAISI